jgi:hypothetical protein
MPTATARKTQPKTPERKLSWSDLFASGSMFQLKTSVWIARTKITAADLGIEATEEVNEALSLGHHRLVPHAEFERMNTILGKARQTIEHYSQQFLFIKGARYVPDRNLETVSGKLKELREEFQAAVDVFLENYSTIKTNTLPIIEKALLDAAKTAEAARAAFERVVAEYPSVDELRGKFRLIWNVYSIQGPKQSGVGAALFDESTQVRGAIKEMVTELRAEASEKVQGLLALVKKGGKIAQRSVDSAMTVLDHIDAVNVFGDEVLTANVATLRAALRGINTDERIPDSIVTSLDDIQRALQTDIDAAVAAAEAKLTGVGRRKLKVA